MHPDVRSSGRLFLKQTFVVDRGQSSAFLTTVANDLLPRAKTSDLDLEGAWRASGNPREFHLLWSAEWPAFAALQSSRNVTSETSHVFELDSVWDTVSSFSETTLVPARISPLGGLRAG